MKESKGKPKKAKPRLTNVSTPSLKGLTPVPPKPKKQNAETPKFRSMRIVGISDPLNPRKNHSKFNVNAFPKRLVYDL